MRSSKPKVTKRHIPKAETRVKTRPKTPLNLYLMMSASLASGPGGLIPLPVIAE